VYAPSRAASWMTLSKVWEGSTRIAKDLDGNYGRGRGVQESGGRLRITASLVRPDGSIEWALRGHVESVGNLQPAGQARRRPGAHLASRLTEVSRQLLAAPLTTDVVAFEDYSRGRSTWSGVMSRATSSWQLMPSAVLSPETRSSRRRTRRLEKPAGCCISRQNSNGG